MARSIVFLSVLKTLDLFYGKIDCVSECTENPYLFYGKIECVSECIENP